MAHVRFVALALVVVAGRASAQDDPALGKLEKALPPGWSLLATDTELVIRHDRPCFVTHEAHDNEPAVHTPAHTTDGRLITLELRYHLEPKWTRRQLDDAKAANDRVAGELKTVRAKYNIDAIKGHPAPTTADERTRFGAYDKEAAALTARQIKLPTCTLGDSSLFDSDANFSQLRLEVDPPEAMKEAHAVVDTLKRLCPS